VAIYRDGSKRSQPLNTRKTRDGADRLVPAAELETRILQLQAEIQRLETETGQPLRRRLPDTRSSITHKFDIAGHEGYLTVGLFENGLPGELFITMSKEGSTIGGLMDGIGTLTSMALQYGVPLEALVKKFAYQRFEPSGFTRNAEIRNASSITDYVFRWLALQFVPGYREACAPNRNQTELPIPGLLEEVKKKVNRPVPELAISEDDTTTLDNPTRPGNGNGRHPARPVATLSDTIAHFQLDAPMCPNCGHITVRNGACFKCLNCGESLGCS
jgi:ribonucleoside-diphosphate reductase alpha chain